MNTLQQKGKTMHRSGIWLTLMKSSLSGTFILLLFSSTVSGLGSVVSRDYRHSQRHYTWQEARSYCRGVDDNTDLATIYTQSNADAVDLKKYYAWIGLYEDHRNEWKWLRGGPVMSWWWASNQPEKEEKCAAASYNKEKVYGAKCEEYFFFMCDGPNEVITQSKTWSEARQHCRDDGNHDLASFSDNNMMKSAAGEKDFPVWTGLHRDGEIWKWSAGLSNYTKWAQGEPGNNGDCVSISSVSKEMATQNCSTRLPFICYRDNLVLVKENKTWEEALEHCRALGSPTQQHLRYDLVSVQPEDYDYVTNKLVEANTEEVWTGLRFLAGEWLWVNGADMSYSDLPLCPHMVQHCGVLTKNITGSMEARDCAERRNFVCYRK